MNAKIQLALLAPRQPRRPGALKDRHQGEEGFSLALVFLVVLALLLGSLAIANRTSSSLLGSVGQSQSRAAREAAETGMNRILSSLNDRRNRRLLVNAQKLDGMSAASINADPTLLSNCGGEPGDTTGDTLPPAPSLEFNSTTNPSGYLAPGTNPKDEQSLTETQRFQLVSISHSNPNFSETKSTSPSSPYADNPDFAVTIGNKTTSALAGEITITVRGNVYNGANRTASTLLTRTIEVVPKCCGRSLRGKNNVFGNDQRICNADLGTGLIVGAAQNNSGTITIKGSSADIGSGTGANLPNVYCLGPATCSSTLNKNLGTQVIVSQESIPDVPVNPMISTAPSKLCGPSSTPANCSVNVTNDVTVATSSFASWSTSSIGLLQSLAAHCIQTPNTSVKIGGATKSVTMTTCSLNSISITKNNTTVTFDTSGGPIQIYFPNNGTVLANANNAGLRHIDSSNPAAGNPPVSPAYLTLYGCSRNNTYACNSQTLSINNGGSSALGLFTYFPYGTITYGGNAAIEGVFWVNSLIANGSITLRVPASGLGDVYGLIGIDGGDDATSTPPLIDWLARSVRSSRYF